MILRCVRMVSPWRKGRFKEGQGTGISFIALREKGLFGGKVAMSWFWRLIWLETVVRWMIEYEQV